MDYGCSNGKEALSIYMPLEDRDKFKIKGIDINKDIINLANNGVYSIFTGGADEFLIPESKKDPTRNNLSKMFYEIMEPLSEPSFPLNNSPEFYSTFQKVNPKKENKFSLSRMINRTI